MSVSLSEIIAGAKVHAVPLAGECAGYLVLAAADQAVTAPRRIGPAEVRLLDDGTVRVEGARAAAESDAEADLRALLDALLVRASSATPALLRASRRAPGRGIAALVREIETALIPVNRAAAHRALARLERETERARHAGRLDLSAPPEVVRSEAPSPVAAPPRPTPSIEPPVVAEEPVRRIGAVEEALCEVLDEIPSLFAPPVEPASSVESIAALAAEIETRPEPVVLRRSTRPPPSPARTPSPPALPVRNVRSPLPAVALRRASPPPLPVAEAPSTTPFFGTVVQSDADEDMEIEVVLDDELLEDELTGVLERSAPLEVSAMPSPTVSHDSSVAIAPTATPDPTDPCPPTLEDELVHEPSAAALAVGEPSGPENTMLSAPATELPAVTLEGSTYVADLVEPAAPAPEDAPLVAEEHEACAAEPENTILLAQTAPMPRLPPAEVPAAQGPAAQEPIDGGVAEQPEPPCETLALALAIDVAVELTPAPRLAMPKPHPSDVEDLLERMTQESIEGSDEIRANLKGLAGLEPTPLPPSPDS